MSKNPMKCKNPASRVLGDEAIVVNFQNSFFFNLNPVGTFIWEHCDGHHSVAQIAQTLTEGFQVDLEAATKDYRQFIEELVEQGLLQWRGEPV